ncbi:MAG: S8 family serine peptidase, partial [Isosphaeraceae bacterium]
DGTGQTIAIVDAYDDPDIFQAVDTFDSQFGLTGSGPTLYAQYGPASSFLTVLNQDGQSTSLPSTDPNGPGTDNWEVEEALDVEWAHATAPGAQIVLVAANSQSLSDLMAAVGTAAHQPGVSVVSMSWGFAEGQAVFAADEAAYDSVFNVPGVTFVASTGDYGAADPEYPAFSPNVVAVGGTTLTLNGDGSYGSETGWGYYSSSVGALIGSGGGISLYEPEPSYQQGVQSTGYRTTPDVSFLADPATGAWIADPYNLDPSDPFEIVGGTSLSAPAWAGLVALVNQGRAAAGESTLNSTSPTDAQQALYMLPQSDYNAITSGNNGYTASAGYNLVTGLGTPVANLLVADLIAYQGAGTTYSGSVVAPLQNSGLVNTGTSDSGPMDVFSVFDSFTATNVGLSNGHAKGSNRVESALGHGTNTAGGGDRRPGDLREGTLSEISSPAGDGLAPPTTRLDSALSSAVDQALGVLLDTNSHDTLIGDLAFEQVSSGNPARHRLHD